MQQTTARAVLTIDGKLEVATATADIGTGTYTILTQIAADALGLPIEDVTVKIGDSSLPKSPVEGGSWTVASVGSAVQAACHEVREKLFEHARRSRLAARQCRVDHVDFADGRIALAGESVAVVSLAEAMRGGGVERHRGGGNRPARTGDLRRNTPPTPTRRSSPRCEVDEELGVVRVTRIVNAVAAGKILNPKTARSQILGGVVVGHRHGAARGDA